MLEARLFEGGRGQVGGRRLGAADLGFEGHGRPVVGSGGEGGGCGWRLGRLVRDAPVTALRRRREPSAHLAVPLLEEVLEHLCHGPHVPAGLPLVVRAGVGDHQREVPLDLARVEVRTLVHLSLDFGQVHWLLHHLDVVRIPCQVDRVLEGPREGKALGVAKALHLHHQLLQLQLEAPELFGVRFRRQGGGRGLLASRGAARAAQRWGVAAGRRGGSGQVVELLGGHLLQPLRHRHHVPRGVLLGVP
mmetsp:Transcript_27251/g.60906  ORF Transcript_27251/g.60906 Transcript_27251/m.60906 type:complete len:247 (+) Transcript_27251:624-1364(+)